MKYKLLYRLGGDICRPRRTSSSAPIRTTASLTTIVLLLSFLAHGADAQCGPYFAQPEVRCPVACERTHNATREPYAGTLSCFCGLSSETGEPHCNTGSLRHFSPGVPAFDLLAPNDALIAIQLTGIAEMWLLQSGAFANVGRRLQVLDLSYNAISRIEDGAFAYLHSLNLLNLSGNHLGEGGLMALPSDRDTSNLETIDLSRNRIQRLDLASFSCLAKLRALHLDHNRLLYIADAADRPSMQLPPSLRTLTLAHARQLDGVTACNFHALCRAMNLTRLSLAGISWTCDCNAHWLQRVYEECAVAEPYDAAFCVADPWRDYGGGDDGGGERSSLRHLNVSSCPAAPTAELLSNLCPVAQPRCHSPRLLSSAQGSTGSSTDGGRPSARTTAPKTVAECGGLVWRRGNLTSPDYPGLYPNSLRCAWRLVADFERVVRIEFLAFSTEWDYDVLYVYDGDPNDPSTVRHMYTGIRSYSPITLGQDVTILFVTDDTLQQTGFFIRFTSVEPPPTANPISFVSGVAFTGCGASFAGSGVLMSPNYPQPYPSNAHCTWRLTASTGQSVQLDFTSFSLEEDYDAVAVYNGSSATPNAASFVYTGSASYRSLTLGPDVTVAFTSDGTVQQAGFHIRFTSVDPRAPSPSGVAGVPGARTSGCGGVLIGQANISSPGYPSVYPRDARCTWVLWAAPGGVVRLEFLVFDVERKYDALDLQSIGGWASVPAQYRYTGPGRYSPILLGSHVTAVFATNGLMQRQGFFIRFTTVMPPDTSVPAASTAAAGAAAGLPTAVSRRLFSSTPSEAATVSEHAVAVTSGRLSTSSDNRTSAPGGEQSTNASAGACRTSDPSSACGSCSASKNTRLPSTWKSGADVTTSELLITSSSLPENRSSTTEMAKDNITTRPLVSAVRTSSGIQFPLELRVEQTHVTSQATPSPGTSPVDLETSAMAWTTVPQTSSVSTVASRVEGTPSLQSTRSRHISTDSETQQSGELVTDNPPSVVKIGQQTSNPQTSWTRGSSQAVSPSLSLKPKTTWTTQSPAKGPELVSADRDASTPKISRPLSNFGSAGSLVGISVPLLGVPPASPSVTSTLPTVPTGHQSMTVTDMQYFETSSSGTMTAAITPTEEQRPAVNPSKKPQVLSPEDLSTEDLSSGLVSVTPYHAHSSLKTRFGDSASTSSDLETRLVSFSQHPSWTSLLPASAYVKRRYETTAASQPLSAGDAKQQPYVGTISDPSAIHIYARSLDNGMKTLVHNASATILATRQQQPLGRLPTIDVAATVVTEVTASRAAREEATTVTETASVVHTNGGDGRCDVVSQATAIASGRYSSWVTEAAVASDSAGTRRQTSTMMDGLSRPAAATTVTPTATTTGRVPASGSQPRDSTSRKPSSRQPTLRRGRTTVRNVRTSVPGLRSSTKTVVKSIGRSTLPSWCLLTLALLTLRPTLALT